MEKGNVDSESLRIIATHLRAKSVVALDLARTFQAREWHRPSPREKFDFVQLDIFFVFDR